MVYLANKVKFLHALLISKEERLVRLFIGHPLKSLVVWLFIDRPKVVLCSDLVDLDVLNLAALTRVAGKKDGDRVLMVEGLLKIEVVGLYFHVLAIVVL